MGTSITRMTKARVNKRVIFYNVAGHKINKSFIYETNTRFAKRHSMIQSQRVKARREEYWKQGIKRDS